MKEAAFAILHDGIIKKISGLIPGTIMIEVQCDYLRKRSPSRGSSFFIELSECKKVFFVNNDDVSTSDFSEIEKLEVDMLSADTEGSDVVVFCSEGSLYLNFKEARVLLNAKDTISIEALEHMARDYWDEWEYKANSIPNSHPPKYLLN
jgi:hypothetical protein